MAADEVRRRKGLGTIYQLPDGRWRAQVDLGLVGGKRLRPTKTCATETLAKRALRDLRDRADVGVRDDPMLGDWLDHWLDVIAPERCKPQTIDGYRSRVTQHIKPALQYVRLSKLTAEHLETLYGQLRRRPEEDGGPLAQATIRQVHAVIRRSLTVAVQRGRLTRNVARDLELRSAPDNPHAAHTRAEAIAIINAARTLRESVRLHLALMCGLRQGEALGLDWADIHEDDPEPHLRVRQAVVRLRGKGLVMDTPKTVASAAPVRLSPATAAVLALWRVESGGVGLVLQSRAGGPVDPSRDARDWHAAEDRAGVPRMPLHGARGSVVSILHAANVPLEVAQEVMRHTSVTTTRKHYLTIGSDRQRDAVNLLGEMMTGPTAAALDAPAAPVSPAAT